MSGQPHLKRDFVAHDRPSDCVILVTSLFKTMLEEAESVGVQRHHALSFILTLTRADDHPDALRHESFTGLLARAEALGCERAMVRVVVEKLATNELAALDPS